MSAKNVTLKALIERLWIAPENAEWKPKTDILPLSDLKTWMESDDIEVLGFMDAMIHDARFRIDPAGKMRYKGFTEENRDAGKNAGVPRLSGNFTS